jgi:hypothetical protein
VSRNQDHLDRGSVLIQEDGRITVSEVAKMLDIRQIEICIDLTSDHSEYGCNHRTVQNMGIAFLPRVVCEPTVIF